MSDVQPYTTQTHDRMCPVRRPGPPWRCACDLIGLVRVDEERDQMDHLKSHRDEWIADGYERGKADAEQAHAAALAEAADRQRARDYVSLWSRLMLEDRKYRAALARAAIVIRQRLTDDDVFRLTGQHVRLHEWETVKPLPADKAAAPRTLTSDCLHLTEMYVGQSSRDNEYGRRSSVIECLACGALRLDDETVPPNRLAGGDFDTSGQPRTLTADDPEPAVGSVVLDANGRAWQRTYVHAWCTYGVGGWTDWESMLRLFAPFTLIHDGEDRYSRLGREASETMTAMDARRAAIHDGEATPEVKPCSTCGEPVAYLTARPGWAGGWLHHPARPLDGHPAAIDGEATT